MAGIKEFIPDDYQRNSAEGIGANSLDLTTGRHFLKATGNVIDKATTGAKIVGVNYTEKVFASDNETVAKNKVVYEPARSDVTYEVEITGGTITVADEQKYFNLTDSDTVDGTTETTVESYVDTVAGTAIDPVIKMQVQLIKFISATKGVFRIVL